MAHRIRIHRTGGPEILRYEAFDVGKPGPGQVWLRQEAASVNFVDTQFRHGICPATLPLDAWTPDRAGSARLRAPRRG